jgi:hypothetical protein
LQASAVMTAGFGADLVKLYSRIKHSEYTRHAEADDSQGWQRREYFSRY